MRNVLFLLVFVCGALFMSGCGVRQTSLTNETYQARPANHRIDLFIGELRPYRKYVQLGFLEKTAEYSWTRSNEILENLKARAREMGGDALILSTLSDGTGTVTWGKDRPAKAEAIVLRYTEKLDGDQP